MIRTNAAALLTCLGFAALASADAVVTFDGFDAQGWEGPQGFGGFTEIVETGGNPGFNMHTVFTDFGITYHNDTSPDFIQDLSGYDAVTFGVDLQVLKLDFFGIDTPPAVGRRAARLRHRSERVRLVLRLV